MRIRISIFTILVNLTLWFSVPQTYAQNAVPNSRPWRVCFTPGDQCADQLIAVLDAAKSSVRVQAYSFTAKDIAEALIRARGRGVDVIVILDKSQTRERFSMIDELKDGGILVYIDDCCAIAHNKVMIIDEQTVVTGSYNFTKSAEVRNAENMLIIDDPVLASRYLANWQVHRRGSDAYAKR